MTPHPTLTEIDRYTVGDTTLDEVTIWAVEVHLEDCADCRARLAGSTTHDSRGVVARVATGLDREIAAGPAPAHRTRPWSVLRTRWFVGTLLPWLTMTVAVLCCSVALATAKPQLPSLVLLLAPLAPLPGVAAAWNRRADPAWELIAGTPAAGLTMLLRRTAMVLAVIIPVLAAAGAGTGMSLALTLLPCLAFTAASLLLGSVIGVRRAVIGLATAWTLAVVAPVAFTAELPAVLQPGSTNVWALTTAALTGLACVRAGSFRRLAERD